MRKHRMIQVIACCILVVALVQIAYSSDTQFVSESILEVRVEGDLYIQRVQSKGFHDEEMILMEVSINQRNHTIQQVKVLAHQETPDYGGHITQNWFLDKFQAKRLNKPLECVNIIEKEEHEIVAITGATISSQAIINGVNIAMQQYNSTKK